MDSDSTSLRARMQRRLPDFDQMRQRIRGPARALRRRFDGDETD